jgi:hypothetical protein
VCMLYVYCVKISYVPFIKQPITSPDILMFDDGLAVMIRDGKQVGHIATSLSKFWSPFRPLSLQWWVWFIIVWEDGTKERSVEEYEPWCYVNEMRDGKITWEDDVTYSLEWVPKDKVQSLYKKLNIKSEDF